MKILKGGFVEPVSALFISYKVLDYVFTKGTKLFLATQMGQDITNIVTKTLSEIVKSQLDKTMAEDRITIYNSICYSNKMAKDEEAFRKYYEGSIKSIREARQKYLNKFNESNLSDLDRKKRITEMLQNPNYQKRYIPYLTKYNAGYITNNEEREKQKQKNYNSNKIKLDNQLVNEFLLYIFNKKFDKLKFSVHFTEENVSNSRRSMIYFYIKIHKLIDNTQIVEKFSYVDLIWNINNIAEFLYGISSSKNNNNIKTDIWTKILNSETDKIILFDTIINFLIDFYSSEINFNFLITNFDNNIICRKLIVSQSSEYDFIDENVLNNGIENILLNFTPEKYIGLISKSGILSGGGLFNKNAKNEYEFDNKDRLTLLKNHNVVLNLNIMPKTVPSISININNRVNIPIQMIDRFILNEKIYDRLKTIKNTVQSRNGKDEYIRDEYIRHSIEYIYNYINEHFIRAFLNHSSISSIVNILGFDEKYLYSNKTVITALSEYWSKANTIIKKIKNDNPTVEYPNIIVKFLKDSINENDIKITQQENNEKTIFMNSTYDFNLVFDASHFTIEYINLFKEYFKQLFFKFCFDFSRYINSSKDLFNFINNALLQGIDVVFNLNQRNMNIILSKNNKYITLDSFDLLPLFNFTEGFLGLFYESDNIKFIESLKKISINNKIINIISNNDIFLSIEQYKNNQLKILQDNIGNNEIKLLCQELVIFKKSNIQSNNEIINEHSKGIIITDNKELNNNGEFLIALNSIIHNLYYLINFLKDKRTLIVGSNIDIILKNSNNSNNSNNNSLKIEIKKYFGVSKFAKGEVVSFDINTLANVLIGSPTLSFNQLVILNKIIQTGNQYNTLFYLGKIIRKEYLRDVELKILKNNEKQKKINNKKKINEDPKILRNKKKIEEYKQTIKNLKNIKKNSTINLLETTSVNTISPKIKEYINKKIKNLESKLKASNIINNSTNRNSDKNRTSINTSLTTLSAKTNLNNNLNNSNSKNSKNIISNYLKANPNFRNNDFDQSFTYNNIINLKQINKDIFNGLNDEIKKLNILLQSNNSIIKLLEMFNSAGLNLNYELKLNKNEFCLKIIELNIKINIDDINDNYLLDTLIKQYLINNVKNNEISINYSNGDI